MLRAPVRLPSPQATEELLRLLSVAEERQAPPVPLFLDDLRRRLVGLYGPASSGNAERRDLRDAPWVLWEGTPRLATLPHLMGAVLDQASVHQRTLRNLIEAWILAFDSSDPTFVPSGLRIGSILLETSDRRLDLWQSSQKRVAIFDAASGPETVARWLLSGPETVPEVLAAVGLNHPVRGGGGYAKVVQVKIHDAMSSALQSRWADQALERVFIFIETDNKLRFPELRSAMARELTGPWHRTRPRVDTTGHRAIRAERFSGQTFARSQDQSRQLAGSG